MKRFAYFILSMALLVGPFLLIGCDHNPEPYPLAMGPQQSQPQQPQVSQQEMMKGVIQDYLNQSSPGTQILGANFLPLTNNLYVSQANLQAGTLTIKKDFTLECVGDSSNPQWQVQPVSEATLRDLLVRYNVYNEVDAIYHHPSYHTESLMEAVLRWHYIYGRPSPFYWGVMPTYGYGCWGFTPMPYYRNYYSSVIVHYPTTRIRTTYLAPRSGVTIIRPRVTNNVTVNKTVINQAPRSGASYTPRMRPPRLTSPRPARTPLPSLSRALAHPRPPQAPLTSPLTSQPPGLPTPVPVVVHIPAPVVLSVALVVVGAAKTGPRTPTVGPKPLQLLR